MPGQSEALEAIRKPTGIVELTAPLTGERDRSGSREVTVMFRNLRRPEVVQGELEEAPVKAQLAVPLLASGVDEL